MTILISKNERDNIGIDCLEKALMYGVLMLKDRILINETVYPQNLANIQWAFQQISGTKYGAISINCQLAHYRELAFKSGGRFPEKIKIFSGGDTDPYIGDNEPSINGIETEPQWVESLEHYISWVIHKLISRFLVNQQYDKFAISYAEDFMSFQTILYIDFLKYTNEYKNYIHCVIPFDEWDLITENNQAFSDGALGFTLRWRGEWSSAVDYQKNDIVSYDFISFIAIDDNSNSLPDLLEKWAIFFAGEIGPQGPQGIQGETGNGIESASFNNGILTLTFTDASTFDTGDLTGPQGEYGYQGLKELITTDYTLLETDRGLWIPTEGTLTLTLPDNFPIGWEAIIKKRGSGVVSLSASNLIGADTITAPDRAVHLLVIDSATWEVTGNWGG